MAWNSGLVNYKHSQKECKCKDYAHPTPFASTAISIVSRRVFGKYFLNILKQIENKHVILKVYH